MASFSPRGESIAHVMLCLQLYLEVQQVHGLIEMSIWKNLKSSGVCLYILPWEKQDSLNDYTFDNIYFCGKVGSWCPKLSSNE